MNQAIEIKSNAFYRQTEGENPAFAALLELVIINTDGYEYFVVEENNEVNKRLKFVETRFLISPEHLADMIVQLQLHQKKLQGITQNADQITALIKRFSE